MRPAAPCRRPGAASGRLQAVVGRVADQVDQRIGQALDHGLVELGLLALGDELDVLAERRAARSWTRRRKRPNSWADRHHADAHRGVAQLARPGARFPRRSTCSCDVELLAAAICLRRDWAMTSSPTRSISSSRRSAGTRTLSPLLGAWVSARRCFCSASAEATFLPERRRTRPAACRRAPASPGRRAPLRCRVGGARPGSRRASGLVRASICSIDSSMSSRTNMNTFSIAARGCDWWSG